MSKSLAAIVTVVVLLSTLAGITGATPDAASALDTGATPADGTVEQATAASHGFQSGQTYWSGTRLRFDASEVVPDGADEDARTFELWRVTSDGRLNQQVRTFTVSGDGTHALQIGGLTGRYAIRYDGQIVYVHDGTGYLRSPPDGSSVTVDSAAFAFERQTIGFTWSDPEVFPGQRTALEIESNRDDYRVAVSGDGLTYANLTELFPVTTYAADHDARSDEDVLILDARASTSFRLDTAVLEPGQRSIQFNAVDTDASGTARLRVNEPDEDGRFESVERREHVGDVIEANLSCTHCFLVVGERDQGMLDVVELRDENDDGWVGLRINTRYAGMDQSASGYPSGVEAYTSPEDSVSRYSSGATLEQVDEELTYNVIKLNELREQQGLRSSGRDRPLQPGELDLTIASTDFLIDRSAYGDRPPFGSQLVIRDETDVETVTLEPRSLGGIEVLTAPDESPPRQNADRLSEVAGPRDQIALGDDLVFRVDLSGTFGYLEANGVGLDTLVGNRDEGIDLRLEQLSGDTTGDLQLERTDVELLEDPARDGLYVVVDTDRRGPDRLKPGEYRLTLELQGVSSRADAYSTSGAHRGYPYLEPGVTESVSAVATVAPPEADITDPAEESPHLNANGELVVEGRTTVAVQSSFQVTATSTEYAWDTSARATVNETGHWTASLPLADAPGDEFTVSVSRDGERLDERTYTVLPPLEEGSDGGGSSGGGSSGDGGPLGGDGGGILSAIPGLSGIAGLALPIGGGIGALVVLWAAWKLVIRRMLI